jgi:3',5'-nucleoside bisphosphate phosphatase
MIDLHSHTHASDGTLSPEDLVREAVRAGVTILGISDHDTFAGYDEARSFAHDAGLELVCGIELSTKLQGQSIHLLGYFFENADLGDFRAQILEMQASRRDRNIRLVARLRELGLDITLDEAKARGRGMTGRPHFAQILLEKGYVQTLQQAFDDYLAEEAKGYVYRREPQFAEGVSMIRNAGGIASIAHPVRFKGDFAAVVGELAACGMNALEAYHSDHSPQDTERFLRLARDYGLAVTGGSDFHGSVKPDIQLGTGRSGNVKIPSDLVSRLREAAHQP